MTHPKEVVEAVARALSGFEPDMWEMAVREGWPCVQYLRNKAIALLDAIAPHYREQAAQVASDATDEVERACDMTDPREKTVILSLKVAVKFGRTIAAAIHKGE